MAHRNPQASGTHPILGLSSEHGSGKTTLSEVVRRLVNPHSAMLRAEPRDVRDVMIAATNSWFVAFDNLSELSPWLSDCLCRLATGGSFSTRELYSDSEEMIFSAQRPALRNGIDDVVTRGDLLDRAILLDLPPIDEERRRPAGELWRAFEAARPRILGALLDAVSQALRRAPLVRLARLPSMADFAIWTTAAAPALGWSDDYFISIYTANREQAHELALDVSPVAATVQALADRGEWSGMAAELLEVLSGLVDEAARRARTWPTTPRYLGGEVRRLAPNLRSVGVEVEFAREARASRRRIITIKKVAGSDRPDRPHRPPTNGGEPLKLDDHSGASSTLDGPSAPMDTVDARMDGSPSRPSTRNRASDRPLDDVDYMGETSPTQSDGHAQRERHVVEPSLPDEDIQRAHECWLHGHPGSPDVSPREESQRHLSTGEPLMLDGDAMGACPVCGRRQATCTATANHQAADREAGECLASDTSEAIL
jgi:hypothetical protein